MFWAFKRKRREAEPAREPADSAVETDLLDRAARNLVEQGVPPHKVARATRLLKRYVREGVLPEGTLREPRE